MPKRDGGFREWNDIGFIPFRLIGCAFQSTEWTHTESTESTENDSADSVDSV